MVKVFGCPFWTVTDFVCFCVRLQNWSFKYNFWIQVFPPLKHNFELYLNTILYNANTRYSIRDYMREYTNTERQNKTAHVMFIINVIKRVGSMFKRSISIHNVLHNHTFETEYIKVDIYSYVRSEASKFRKPRS